MYKRKDGYLRLVTLLVFRLVERIEKYAAGAEHLNRPLCVRMTYISNVLVQLLLHSVWKSPKNVSFRKYFVSAEYLKKCFRRNNFEYICFNWNSFENFQILWTDVILYSEHLGKSAFSISSALPLLGIQDSARWVLVILVCIHQVFVIYKPQTWKSSCQACRQVLLKTNTRLLIKALFISMSIQCTQVNCIL